MVPQAAFQSILPAPGQKPRPPTPPQEADTKAISFERGFAKGATSQAASTITPSSSADSPATGIRKKVNWATNGEAALSPILQLVPSSGERKPIKSILKPYNGVNVINLNPSTAKLTPAHEYPSLAAMLESIIQQLAGDDRNSKMDAYTTLSGTIKASDNVPEMRALKERMGTLLQYIKRDLTARNTTGSFDTSLIIHNLILLSSFLHKPAIAELLTNEFSAYVVDHAIKTFEDPGMSKDIVKHLMFVLAQQQFSSKVMSETRVARLIRALHDIENFVKGKSIVIGRLEVYRNLIRHSKSSMMATTEWLDDTFSDMLSSLKDTRTTAIELGLESALVLGQETKPSRAVMELFARAGSDAESTRFVDFLMRRLMAMVKEKQDAYVSVPRIWSVLVLFLRSRPRQLEHWGSINAWLKVIGVCFNSSDQQLKLEANLAWNRLIFAVRPDEKTSPNFINILGTPLFEQLKRKTKSLNLSKTRRATLSSVCILLYYSFRPDATAVQIDLYWKHYIVQIVQNSLSTTTSSKGKEVWVSEPSRFDVLDVCRILEALFDTTTPRPWRELRAMELTSPEAAMETTELPALDSKWLRKSAPQVFPVLSQLLEALYWDLNEDSETISGVWKAYITSIASPAVKEVKVSNDTMSSIAHIFDFLYRIWHIGPNNVRSLASCKGSGNFLGSFGKIVLQTIEGLGILPFTEKLLSIGNQDTFTVIATPSHGNRGTRGDIRCPLHHLLVLLTNFSPGLDYDSKYSHLVRQILSPFFNSRTSSKARMDLVKDLLHLLPAESNEPSRLVWQVLAEFASLAADLRDTNNSFGNSPIGDQLRGMEYRSSIKILEVGMDLSPAGPLPGWQKVFEALITSSTIDAGDGGRAIAVVDPMARSFVAKSSGNDHSSPGMQYCRLLVSNATYPKDRQALEGAQRRLWGVPSVPPKSFPNDPYSHLYDCLRICLENSYTNFAKDHILYYADLFNAMTGLLKRCPHSVLMNFLCKVQKGISCWIQDNRSKIGGGTPLSHGVHAFWTSLCSHLPYIKKNDHSHNSILRNLEPLFLAGLESKHRSIVTLTIKLWNAIFGDCETILDYPPLVTEALVRLLPVADLKLPSFPESLDIDRSAEARQPITFDTQDDGSLLDAIAPLPVSSIRSVSRPRKSIPQVVIQVNRSMTTKRPREETPEMGNRKSKKRVSTPKLRHDDSQIRFEAIESSPLADLVLDSQLLTDRQKEVKERQQAEATMFPDIRSSPRPREKQTSRRSVSVELPFHRSSSKSRAASSPTAVRQTTPVLIPQGEDDDFVNSSPTPTRAITGRDDELDGDVEIPSSPPEEAPLDGVENINEGEFPSSPPDMIDGQDQDTTTSLDPSAQVENFAFDLNHTVSSVEFTPSEKHKSIVSDSFEKEGHVEEIAASGLLQSIQEPPSDKHLLEKGDDPPNTPDQLHSEHHLSEHMPKTPVFHDALSSPASSGILTGDEFQDALSSPRLGVDHTKVDKVSSPLSDLDESSMLRIMNEYDQVPRPPGMSIESMSDKDVLKTRSSLPSPDKSTLPVPSIEITLTSSVQEPAEQSAFDITDVMTIDEAGAAHPSRALQTSSIPSRVPETPAVKAANAMSFMDGEEYDPNDTIIVEVPEDFEAYPKRSKKKKIAASPRKRSSLSMSTLAETPSKRRKSSIESEVPDSQEAHVMGPPPSQTTGGRKRTGPKSMAKAKAQRKSPRQQSLPESSQESEVDQSFTSVDFDILMPSIDSPMASESFSLVEKEPEIQSAIAETEMEESLKDEPEMIEKTVVEESSPEGIIARILGGDISDVDDMRTIEDAAVEGCSSFAARDLFTIKPDVEMQNEADALNNPDPNVTDIVQQGAMDSAVTEEAIIQGDSQVGSEPLVETADAAMQTESPPALSLKDKIQALLDDIDNKALSTAEGDDLDYMLIDARGRLTRAVLRGRPAGT